MASHSPLFLFYEEPDPDRWVPGDHLPRRWIRRLIRGKPRPGGVMRWFLNLRSGLDEIHQAYRVNDYRGLRNHPKAPALVIGKPHVVAKIPKGHPIIYGPGIDDHPSKSALWNTTDIRRLVIPCHWFEKMYIRDLPCPIQTVVWPAGIETEIWKPPANPIKSSDILIYDKIRWQRGDYEPGLITPIARNLQAAGCTVHTLRYGFYREEDYHRLLKTVRAMVFLCEHETQGFAYQQALSSGVPVLAWDRGGYWQDPQLFPDRVKFGPVSSVPYWDPRCGERFTNLTEFESHWPNFWEKVQTGGYPCRDYVLENLTLAGQARAYVQIVSELSAEYSAPSSS
jgi:hypothetical protein